MKPNPEIGQRYSFTERGDVKFVAEVLSTNGVVSTIKIIQNINWVFPVGKIHPGCNLQLPLYTYLEGQDAPERG